MHMIILGLMAVILAVAQGTATAAVPTCTPALFPASGQTTVFTADKKGVPGAAVPADGTVQAGATLSYQDNGDGTITDLNTGLIWEQKLPETDLQCTATDQATRELHCANNVYAWSNLDADTIWDWPDSLARATGAFPT